MEEKIFSSLFFLPLWLAVAAHRSKYKNIIPIFYHCVLFLYSFYSFSLSLSLSNSCSFLFFLSPFFWVGIFSLLFTFIHFISFQLIFAFLLLNPILFYFFFIIIFLYEYILYLYIYSIYIDYI